MSPNETYTRRRAVRWVRVLGAVVTVGLLASVGVTIGAYGQHVAGQLSVWFERPPVGVDSVSVAPTVLHDASVLGGLLTVAGAGWLALLLFVRVVVRLSTSE